MARQPNYNFERKERERVKAEKKAKRAAAKKDSRQDPAENPDAPNESDDQSPS